MPTASEPGLTRRQIRAILSGLLLGVSIAALDQTIVSTAIRSIGDDLHGLSLQSWVTTAFLITTTISTPLYGKLSDIYGRRPLYLIAIMVFVAGSALCGLATSMYMLAGFRAVQGVGAGGLMSLAMAIIADVTPARERARYQGYFTGVFVTSSVLGPVVGGVLAGSDHLLGITGWRWIFYINVPIGIAACVVAGRVLNLDHGRITSQGRRIDAWGATALVIAVTPLLVVAEQGSKWGWLSGAAFACYAVGAVGVAWFIHAEVRAGEEALLPVKLFRIRSFAVGACHSVVVGVGMFGGMMSIPLYLQIVKGASPTEAGLLMLPVVGGIAASSLVVGVFVSRTGKYKIFPVLGGLLLVAGLLSMSTVGVDTPLWRADVFLLMFGVGLGWSLQPITLAMQNAVAPSQMGVASSATVFFRQVGGTLGTAVFLSILFTSASNKIPARYARARQEPRFQTAARLHQDQLPNLQRGQAGDLQDTSFLHHLDATLARPFLLGFSSALDIVFIVGAAVLAIGFLLSLALRDPPLR